MATTTTTKKKTYTDGSKASAALAQALQHLPDNWVMCRDVRHAWAVANDYHVVPQTTEGRRITHIGRTLLCMRCPVVRQEVYLNHSANRLEKISQHYEYPEGYQIQGVPRGVKPSQIVQAEMYRRMLEKVAGAARGERDRADR